MLWTLSRLDKLTAAWRAFAELGMMDGTAATYTAMIQAGGEPRPQAAIDGNDEEEDNGPATGPKTLAVVELARLSGAAFFFCVVQFIYTHPIHSARLPEFN